MFRSQRALLKNSKLRKLFTRKKNKAKNTNFLQEKNSKLNKLFTKKIARNYTNTLIAPAVNRVNFDTEVDTSSCKKTEQ